MKIHFSVLAMVLPLYIPLDGIFNDGSNMYLRKWFVSIQSFVDTDVFGDHSV